MKISFVLTALIIPQLSFALIDRNNSGNFLKDNNGNILEYCKTYYLAEYDALKLNDKISLTIGHNTKMIRPNSDEIKSIKFFLTNNYYQYESKKYPIQFYPENNIYSTYCENEKLNSFKINLFSTENFIKIGDYIYYNFKKFPTKDIEKRKYFSLENEFKISDREHLNDLEKKQEESRKRMNAQLEESRKRMNAQLEESRKRMNSLLEESLKKSM